MNIGAKMETKSYNADEEIIKRIECKNEPICILFDGEVENLRTSKVINVGQLLWDIDSEPNFENGIDERY